MPQNLVAVYARFMLEKRNKRQLRDAVLPLKTLNKKQRLK